MQCQVKTSSLLALVIISFGAQMLFADQSAPDIDWSAFNGKSVEVEDFSSAQGEVISSYIPFFKELGQKVWGWDPEKELKNSTNSIYREPPPAGFNELMKSLFVEYDVSSTEHFRKVWFKPTSSVSFRGLFGIHDFKKLRPFIFLRLGIHGNVDELIAERFLLKIIYENLDANVLVIESLTSHAFLSKNDKISIGGVDEGIQTFLALNEISKSQFNRLVKSVHIVSLSMGSHGTFVTSMLDQHNGHKIKTILNFCPLVNLKQTFDYHNNPESNLQNALIDLWNVRRLNEVFRIYERETTLKAWWRTIFDLKPRFTPGLLELIDKERHQPLISVEEIENLVPNMQWPTGLREHFLNSKGVFDLNDFWKYYQNIETAITIYTTPNDPLVLNRLNSELIFTGKQPGDFKLLNFQRLDRGIHCGLAPVYTWDYIVGLVKSGLAL